MRVYIRLYQVIMKPVLSSLIPLLFFFFFSYSSDRTTIAPDSSRLSCISAFPCCELQNTPLSPSAAPVRMLSHDAAQQKHKAGEKGRANHAMQDVNGVLVGSGRGCQVSFPPHWH